MKAETGNEFPDEPMQQLELAIRAVFNSWNNERAFRYREIEKIAHDLGTAVNVQTMVFGNMGADSGTGVAFTRDASTGERTISGEYLINAQGEDVVAGIRTPSPIGAARARQRARCTGSSRRSARHAGAALRRHDGRRVHVREGAALLPAVPRRKRAAAAAVKIAVDMANEGLISQDEALTVSQPERLNELLHPRIDPRTRITQLAPVAATSRVLWSRSRRWSSCGTAVSRR